MVSFQIKSILESVLCVNEIFTKTQTNLAYGFR